MCIWAFLFQFVIVLGLNSGSWTCQASALPLNHTPIHLCFHFGLSSTPPMMGYAIFFIMVHNIVVSILTPPIFFFFFLNSVFPLKGKISRNNLVKTLDKGLEGIKLPSFQVCSDLWLQSSVPCCWMLVALAPWPLQQLPAWLCPLPKVKISLCKTPCLQAWRWISAMASKL